MKILVVGGGIGGLAAAGFLEQKGFEVTLLERAREWKHIGFALSLYSNGQKMLEKLGIGEKITTSGYVLPWVELQGRHGSVLYRRNMSDFEGRRDKPTLFIERAVLHDTLVKNLKTTTVRLGTTARILANEKDGVKVEFADGTQGDFDLVVAADGVHSEIREKIFSSSRDYFYGWSARSFWVPQHFPRVEGAVLFSEEKMTIGLFPSGGRNFIVMYEYNPEKIHLPPPPIDDFFSCVAPYGWTRQHLRDALEEAQHGRQYYDHLRRIDLNEWYQEGVVLVGDAQHGYSPVTGTGANMAIEDGFVLADELGHTPGDIGAALERYAKRRAHRLEKVRGMNEISSDKVYLVRSAAWRIVRDTIARLIPKKFIGGTLRQILDEPI